MAFDLNEVSGTCTCCHVCEWDYTLYGTKKEKTEYKIRILKDLIESLKTRSGFKLFMATVTEAQLETQEEELEDDDTAESFSRELLVSTGWQEAARGEQYMPYTAWDRKFNGNREEESGYLTIWAVSPPVFHKEATEYLRKLERELEVMKKGAVTEEELAKRRAFPELKVIHLRKADLISDDTLLENVVSTKLRVTLPALVMHLKVKFGVDFQDVFNNNFGNATYRQMKEYHADWRAGRK